jgi:large subunit ribosomal protein L10
LPAGAKTFFIFKNLSRKEVSSLAISREKKEQLVKEYLEDLNDSEAIIFTEYRGLTVTQLQQLRSKIREAEGAYSVVKNTLAQRALTEADLSVDDDLLTGPVGIGFCHHNVTGVAKAMVDFAKENELLVIKGGLMGDKLIDPATIKNLADLPSLEVLRAQILGLINSPASKLTGVVAGGVRQLVNVLNAYTEKDQDAEALSET